MKHSPCQKLPAQQFNWAQVWVNDLIEHNRWVPVESIPIGRYLYLDDE